MSYAKDTIFQPKDWEFYQAAVNAPDLAHLPGKWADSFEPNDHEEIYDETFEDSVEVILTLKSDDTKLFLTVEILKNGEPLKKDHILSMSCEDEQSLLDKDMVGFLVDDEWHILFYHLPNRDPVTFPYKTNQ